MTDGRSYTCVKCVFWSPRRGSRGLPIKGHNTQHNSPTGQSISKSIMVEIFFKSIVRAIGKVLLMKLTRTPIKTHKGDEKWPLFVNKQLFCWSASITLGNNNAVLTDF